MRATLHNARLGTAKHNDRKFDSENAEHIDKERSKNNQYSSVVQGESFDIGEKIFYVYHFLDYLENANAKNKKQRHPEKCRTIDEYLTGKNTCPESSILQIGNLEKNAGPLILTKAFNQFLEWRKEKFPQLQNLNTALHLDEKTPHIHERRVWICHDENGNERVGQNKALEEMGVPLPNPNAKRTRFNNRKQTFDRICREKWLEIIKSYGVELETTPADKRKHVPTKDYIREKIKANEELNKLESKLRETSEMLDRTENKLVETEEMVRTGKERLKELEKGLNPLEETQEALRRVREDPPKVEAPMFGDKYVKTSVKTGQALVKLANDYESLHASYYAEIGRRQKAESKVYRAEQRATDAETKLNDLQMKCQDFLKLRPKLRSNFSRLVKYADILDRQYIADCCIKNAGKAIYGHIPRVVSMYQNQGFKLTPEQVNAELHEAEERLNAGAGPRPNFGQFDESKEPWNMLSKMTQDAKRLSISNLDRWN